MEDLEKPKLCCWCYYVDVSFNLLWCRRFEKYVGAFNSDCKDWQSKPKYSVYNGPKEWLLP